MKYAIVVCACLVLASFQFSDAGEGSLDPGFGTAGIVTTDITGSSDDSANAVVIQSDGKIIVAGTTLDTLDRDFMVIRYNTSGSLDTTFGNNGVVTTDFGATDDRGIAVALQSDGKIVVAGRSNQDFAVARYNTN